MGWKFEACRLAFSQNPPFQGTGKPMLSQAMEDRDIRDKMTGKVFGTSFALIVCKSMLLIRTTITTTRTTSQNQGLLGETPLWHNTLSTTKEKVCKCTKDSQTALAK